jgi:2'-5' RNA ligase
MKKIYAVYCRIKLVSQPDWLDNFREKYDEKYDFHLTLKQAAHIEEGQLEDIKKRLNVILEDMHFSSEKIRLCFDKVLLDKDEGYIYVFASNSEILDSLQKQIRAELKDYSDYINPLSKDYEYNFRPHVTIARNLNSLQFEKAASELKDDVECIGEVTDLVLSCVKEISLKESKNPDNLTIYKLQK